MKSVNYFRIGITTDVTTWMIQVDFNRVRTGRGKLGKSLNFMVGYGKSWKIVIANGKLIMAVSKQS